MNDTSTASKLDQVTFKDWFFALIGLLFTLSALFTLRNDFKLGITALVLFGACFAVSVGIILRKYRHQRFSSRTPMSIGGEPLRPSRSVSILSGLGLLLTGTTLILFLSEREQSKDAWIALVSGWTLAIAGGGLLVAVVTGLLSRAFIQLTPKGIAFGHFRGKAMVPWSAITKVSRVEMDGSQAILLWVNREEVSAEPSSFLAQVHKKMAFSDTWAGADFVIRSANYGIDAPALVAALNRYITSPGARLELCVAPPHLGG